MANGYEDIEKLNQEQNTLLEQQQNKQNEIINQQTQMQVDALQKDKEKLDQEAQKTASGLYSSYMKQANQYGAGMEQLQEQGLANSGYAETSRTSLYNTYQKSVTDTLNKSNELKADYDFKMDQARQQGSVRQAQSALDLYAQRLQLLTQNYQLRQDREKYLYQQGRDKIADQRWQDQFNYQKGRDTLEDQRWQKQFDYQKNRDTLEDRRWQDQFNYQKQRDAKADQQWQAQYALSKKKLASSGSSRRSSSKSNYKVSNNQKENTRVREEQPKQYSAKEVIANMKVLQGPGLKNNILDKISGKTFSSPDALLNYYGYVGVK